MEVTQSANDLLVLLRAHHMRWGTRHSAAVRSGRTLLVLLAEVYRPEPNWPAGIAAAAATIDDWGRRSGDAALAVAGPAGRLYAALAQWALLPNPKLRPLGQPVLQAAADLGRQYEGGGRSRRAAEHQLEAAAGTLLLTVQHHLDHPRGWRRVGRRLRRHRRTAEHVADPNTR